jgi:hypothetical protein
MQDIDASAHSGDDQACDRADQRRERDQARFTRSHDGAQTSRYLQLARNFI